MRSTTSAMHSGPASRIARKRSAAKHSAAFAILFLLLGAAAIQAVELKQATGQAWDAYVQDIDSTVQNRAAGRSQFLLVDETPGFAPRVRGGELVVTNHDPKAVPHGLIHDWTGVMFIPGVTLDQVMSVLDNYDRYTDYYKPLIAKSAVVERNGDNEKVELLAVQKAFSVTAAVDSRYDVQIVRLDSNRIYIVSKSESVQEIADFGQPSQHPFPEQKRPGYVWRTVELTRLEQRDGGVYVEMETIALSRGIPVEFRWLIKPLTDNLPRKIMLKTLEDTRAAVSAQSAPGADEHQATAQNHAQ